MIDTVLGDPPVNSRVEYLVMEKSRLSRGTASCSLNMQTFLLTSPKTQEMTFGIFYHQLVPI
jgi:hypothetical protein